MFLDGVVFVVNDIRVPRFFAVETGLLRLFSTPLADSLSFGLLGDNEEQTRSYPLVYYHAPDFGHTHWASIVISQNKDRGQYSKAVLYHQNQIVITKQRSGVRRGRQRVRRNVQKHGHCQQYRNIERNSLASDWWKAEAHENESHDHSCRDDQVKDVVEHLSFHVDCDSDVGVSVRAALVEQLVSLDWNIQDFPLAIFNVRGHLGSCLSCVHVQKLDAVCPRSAEKN